MMDLHAMVQAMRSWSMPILLGFDVDGTLAPIVKNPEDARVPEEMQSLLKSISQSERAVVALVTGRDHEALKTLCDPNGFWCATQHGKVITPPRKDPKEKPPSKQSAVASTPLPASQTSDLTPRVRDSLDRFRKWAQQHLQPQGAYLEDKPNAIGIHTRAFADSSPDLAQALLHEAEKEASNLGLFVRSGRWVCEVELHAVGQEVPNKATALKSIMEQTNARSVCYVGDDITDFPAIEWAAEQGGLGIWVKSDEVTKTPQAYSWVMSAQSEMKIFLRTLEQFINDPRSSS